MHGNHAWAYISVSDDGGTFASAVKGSITSAVTRTDLSEHVKVAPRALPGEWPSSDMPWQRVKSGASDVSSGQVVAH